MKKSLIVVLLLSISVFSFSQQKSAASATGAGTTRWEYMTVCFGKTYFNDAEKSLLYFGDEDLPSEGTGLQEKLDILGTNGWEVIGIVGAIGGDQQILLKRLYNAQVSDSEKKKVEALKKERDQKRLTEFEAFLKEQERLAQEERDKGLQIEAAATKKEVLVDRDQLDAWDIQKRKLSEQEALVKQEREADEKYILSLFDAYQYEGMTKTKQVIENGYELTLSFDLTNQYLVNTNQYRSSETQKFAEDRLNDIRYDERTLKRTHVSVRVHCYITYNKQKLEVGTASADVYPYNPDK